MASLLKQARAEGWIGGDVSDIPVAVQAGALTAWDRVTGWLPREGNREELQAFCGRIIARLSSMGGVDIYLPEPEECDGMVEVYNLDILLAIGAGISQELQNSHEQQRKIA
ncbi:hypothetical protein BH09PAT4_BH09PAT4_02350 [soil metagenome]